MYFLAKYGVQTDIRFPMVKRGVVDLAATADWTPATGDTKISIDGGTVANATNNPVAIAGTGSVSWKLTLTASNLTGGVVNVQIVDSATKAVEDQYLTVYTYGNASAKIVFDYSDPLAAISDFWNALTSTMTTTGSVGKLLADNITGNTFTRLGAPAGASIVADIAAVQADTDNIQTRIPAALVSGRMDTSVGAVAANAITAASMAADASAEIADQVWDEVLSGHLTATTTGAALNGAGSAGDPWITALPGAYGAGTAGKIIGDKIMASVTGAVGSVTGAVGSVTGNVGGSVTGSVASVTGAVGSVTGLTAADVAAIKAKTDNLPDGIRKNTALANFEFLMVDSTDHVTPKTGLTITAQRSIDGAAFAACANAASEVSAGIYKISLNTTDMNGDVITLKFTGTAADARYVTLVTQA